MSDILRTRGDTYRIRRTVKAAGVVVDITDWTFLLTINMVAKPADETDQVAQIAGVIFDAAGGIVDFTPLTADVADAGSFFYDIESVDDSGAVTTLDKGGFILLQDITKTPEVFEWTPPTAPADGDPVIYDGSEHLWV